MSFARFKKRCTAFYYVMVRGKGTPEYIARGWAIGMFYGCFIPFGFQLILSVPTSVFLKGSKIGAVFGTLITNPVTIFFIYPLQCYVGNRILGGNLSWARCNRLMENLTSNQLSLSESIQEFSNLGGSLIAAFFIGGALLTAVMTPITYFGVKGMVVRYREFRSKRNAGAVSAE